MPHPRPEPPPEPPFPPIDDAEGKIIIFNGIDEMNPDFPLERWLNHVEGWCNTLRFFSLTSGRTLPPYAGVYQDRLREVVVECLKRGIRPRITVWDDCFPRVNWLEYPFNDNRMSYQEFISKPSNFMSRIIPHTQHLVSYLDFTYNGVCILPLVEWECTNESRPVGSTGIPRPYNMVGVISKTLQDMGVKVEMISDSSCEDWAKIMYGVRPWCEWVGFGYPQTVGRFSFHGMPKQLLEHPVYQGREGLDAIAQFFKNHPSPVEVELSSDGIRPRPSPAEMLHLATQARRNRGICRICGVEWLDHFSREWRRDPGLVTHHDILKNLNALKEFVK